MEQLIIVVHVMAAVAIIGLVLIQHGKGADMGASFGSGASQTIFGSAGTGNALTKSTTWLAIIFFATSLGLAVYARQHAADAAGVQAADTLLANPDAATAPVSELPSAAKTAPAAATETPTVEAAAPQQPGETPTAPKAVEPAK
jgi:preprotein translocase subunit SecG